MANRTSRPGTCTKSLAAFAVSLFVVATLGACGGGATTAVSVTCQSDLTTAANHPDDKGPYSAIISSLIDCKSKDEWLAAANKASWSGGGSTTPDQYISDTCSGLSYPACK